MNLNPIDFNYIDATNSYPIQDYIDEEINNLLTKEIYTSNIIVDNNHKLNDLVFYNNSNIIIQNNVAYGDILFKTSYSYPVNSNLLGTKVDYTGKLLVYHNYNILQPTFAAGYYDVEGEILSLKADGINTDLQLTALDALVVSHTVSLQQLTDMIITVEAELSEVVELINTNDTYEDFRNVLHASDFNLFQQGFQTLSSTLYNRVNNTRNYAFSTGLLTSLGLGLAGAAIGATVSYVYYEQASNVVFNNSNISSNNAYTVLNQYTSNPISVFSNFDYSIKNLNNFNGFINSNTLTTQKIPNITTSNIIVNNTGSTTYSTINFSNTTNNSAGYIGLGGIVSGYHNNNIVYNTPSAHIFNVPGQSSLSIPAFSINASSCVGIAINPSAYPLYRLSVSGDVYIHNSALRTNSIIYNSQELSTTLNNYLLKSGGTMTGSLTTNSIIYNNVELSTTLTDYLLKAGGTMNGRIVFNTGYYQDPSPTGFGDRIVLQSGGTGYSYSVGINTDVFWHSAPSSASYKFYSGATNTATLNNTGLLTLSSINATTSITTPSIIYGGTELNTTIGNYLLKSGGTMTGQLAITANSASSLISLTNTGTVGQGILQTNNLGGYARLTYYNSGAGGYYTGNYVLEASSNNACIVLNTGGNTSNSIPRIILLASGNVGIGISNPSAKLEVNGRIGCIGVLNCWSNVGIGVTDPSSQLHVRGTNPNLIIMAQGGAGATSTLNLSTYDHTTNAPNCSLIATDTGDFGATFQIKQKLAGANTNGQFTSFIMNVDGNVGIGTTTLTGIKLYVGGKATFQDIITLPNGLWNKSADGVDRFYYNTNGTTFFHSGNSDPAFVFRSFAQSDIVTISNSGNIAGNAGTFGGIIYPNGDNIKFPDTLNQFKINLWGTNLYGFGIASGTLMYSTQNWHKFYNLNVNTFTIDNNGDASLLRNLVTGGLTRSRNYHNYGTTLDYRTSFDGTNGPGWYMPTNAWWQDISTVSYLCVAITCLGQNAVWFGRIFLGQGGGFYQTICDMRNPNGGTNTIDVADVWNSGGVNALKITINNAVYGGQFNVKFSG